MPETVKERDKRWLPVVAICLALIGAAMWVSTLLPMGQARTAETPEIKEVWPQVLCVRDGRLLRTNADGTVVLEKVKSSKKVGYGFDAYKEVYCDMMSSGIVDPTKVTRSALENAASVAGTLLTTEALVADKPEPPAPAMPADPGMGMY